MGRGNQSQVKEWEEKGEGRGGVGGGKNGERDSTQVKEGGGEEWREGLTESLSLKEGEKEEEEEEEREEMARPRGMEEEPSPRLRLRRTQNQNQSSQSYF